MNFIPTVSASVGGHSSPGSREVFIPLSLLGLTPGANVDFFATLISGTQFSSNEGIPNPNIGSNPGFGSSSVPVTWANYDRFVTAAIPEPTAALAIPVACLITGLVAWPLRRWRQAAN